MINQVIHGLDLLLWFVGMPAEVFAWRTRRVHTGIEVEDTACAVLKFAGGARRVRGEHRAVAGLVSPSRDFR